MFNTTLYDKGEVFPFSIVCMPYRDSNLPYKFCPASISSEILRLARTNSEKSPFISSSKILMRRMYKQGRKYEHLKKFLNTIYGRHVTDFEKFTYTADKLID